MGQSKGLSAILVTGHLGYDLCSHITCREKALWCIDHSLADHRSILKHVLQVNEVTVMLSLSKIVRIMKMNDPLFVCLYNIRWKQQTAGQILADLSRHIVALGGVDHRILVGIFLVYFLVNVIDQCQDPVVSSVGFTGKFPLVPVTHILLCYFISPHLHDTGLYHVLYILYMDGMSHGLNLFCNILG